jgi:hypothetical protein
VGRVDAERLRPARERRGAHGAARRPRQPERPDAFHVVNADAVVHALGPAEARRVRYFEEAQLLGPDGLLLHVTNPETVDDGMDAFYRSAADQILDVWLEDDGLQYVSLRKSPCGFVGTTSLVEYVDEPPYLRVQHPPATRENPYACE